MFSQSQQACFFNLYVTIEPVMTAGIKCDSCAAFSLVPFVRVGTIAEIGAAESFTQTFADRVEGRYVTLTLPGSGKILSLCEVEVYGYRAPTGENMGYYINKCEKYAVILMLSVNCGISQKQNHLTAKSMVLNGNCVLFAGENLALQGKATQSSLYAFGIAYNAIDGNNDSKWEDGSCSHTNNDISPWWRLDLRKTHKVFSVKITNIDTSPERLDGAEIRIGDSLENNGNDNAR